LEPTSGHLAYLMNTRAKYFSARWSRFWLIIIPGLWLFLFFFIPFVIVGKISFSQAAIARPPYLPLWEWSREGIIKISLNLENFAFLLQDRLYIAAYLNSIKIAFFSTLITLVIAYPIALSIARAPERSRNLLLMAVILPFWTSFLLRVYAWIGMLKTNGIINDLGLASGLISKPLAMLHTDFAIYVGIVYAYLPFMILPLYAVLVKIENDLLEAASDLGARPLTIFLTVIVPLSLPGIIAGSMLVFIPAIGEFVIPTLLGGPGSLMIGRVVWDEFFANRDWPMASALSVAMLLLLIVPILILRQVQSKFTGAE